MKIRALLSAALFLSITAACAPASGRVESAATQQAIASTPRPLPDWSALEKSDVPRDPAFHYGQLPNGMRYIVRQNATPKGTAIVRMQVESGSLSESDAERGYAHFVEHMAFNGSTHVPEGEMIKLLEREGLAFGPDTNAFTSFEQTRYKLDLPRTDPALLDTALMLMRETASELTMSDDAVERERGVILAEKRDRNTYAMRELEDELAFSTPGAHFVERLPIGTDEALNAATGAKLRAFWSREYVPGNTTVVVIGDFPVADVEAAIARHFADWQPEPMPGTIHAGPVPYGRKAQTDIYIDPALSERVTAFRHGKWQEEPDSIATRQRAVLKQIGYDIINRRLKRLARQADAPYQDAGFGTGDIFKVGRTTNLIIDTSDGGWEKGLRAAAREYRRALAFGFTQGEVDEQITRIRTATQDLAAAADTRNHRDFEGMAFDLVENEKVPSTPQSALERFESFVPQITPESVLAALTWEVVPLEQPFLRFQGRNAPAGGEDAVRNVWKAAMAEKLEQRAESATTSFAYDNFGAPGTVISDETRDDLGIRTIRFANGVRLNLKNTTLERDRVQVRVNIDGGKMLDTRENPLATDMTYVLPRGGLGQHSEDELDTILAGHSVSLSVRADTDTFAMSAQTTPRDLLLQLQVLAASVSDPGYRIEGEQNFRRGISNYFAQKDATPNSALSAAMGGILSDNDPRFTLQPEADYRALTFAGLKDAIGERLAHGAVEIALVGDMDEDAAIAAVAATFGALPPREADFRPYDERRDRPFTADRSERVIHHGGLADQAAVRYIWPTRDDSDPVETITLELLEKIVKLQLTDTLREKLGEAYSPGAASDASHDWKGYGTFMVAASVDTSAVPATEAAIRDVMTTLTTEPVSADLLQRARQPMLERYDNALKTNGGWMALVVSAQSEPDRIERFLKGKARLGAITPDQLLAMAKRYLTPDKAVEVIALPEGVSTTAP
ncbi:MAG: M16 family metallopeptidase [Novosphingobium sp.]